MLKVVVSSTLGFLFGWAMEKAKVYEPLAIKDQMIFHRFIMLKMFLAALGTSTLSIILLRKYFRKSYNNIFETYRDSLKNKSYLLLGIGGALIGCGIQISGACPGMVLVQLGAGVPMAFVTFAGALAGALVHGLLNTNIMKLTTPDFKLSRTFFETFNIDPDTSRGLFVLVLGTGVALMEYFIPWTKEYPNAVGSSNFLFYKAWPPALCGVLLGSLQFFNILLLGKSLGASSCFSTLASVPFFSKSLQDRFQYLAKFRHGVSNWLTVVFVCGAIAGGFVSSYSSGVYGKSDGVDKYHAFIGGFLMVFGARMAGGCTSGHGISGCSYQFMGSFLATGAMFSSAIALGLLSK
jgi:uncharacterized membrane protein YedE/YeeE